MKILNRYNFEDNDFRSINETSFGNVEPSPLKCFLIYLDTTSGSRDIVV